MPLMIRGPEDDAFQPEWIWLALSALITCRVPVDQTAAVKISVANDFIQLRTPPTGVKHGSVGARSYSQLGSSVRCLRVRGPVQSVQRRMRPTCDGEIDSGSDDIVILRFRLAPGLSSHYSIAGIVALSPLFRPEDRPRRRRLVARLGQSQASKVLVQAVRHRAECRVG